MHRAIVYAEEIGIDILNFSGGWLADSPQYDYALQSAIENYSGLFVCAAGNNGRNNDEFPDYPSCYNLTNLISVGASNAFDAKCDYSNFGATTVHIFAPGELIMSTLPNGSYGRMSGTSMAAPYVAGVTALMLSLCPDLTPYEIKTKIMTYGDTVSGLSDKCVSGARLNAYTPLLYLHTWEYSPQSLSWHLTYCSCGEEKMEAHSWLELGTKYKCGLCGYITNSLPVIIQKLDQGQIECTTCAE